MKKFLLFLFVLFLFFQFSANTVNALECSIGCKQNGAMSDLRCYYQLPIPKVGSVYSSCMINPQNDGTTTAWSYGSYCYDATNNNFCKSDGCPTSSDNSDVANQNGAACKVILPCVSGSSCSSVDLTGKWDANEDKCVKCSAVVTQAEDTICGDVSGIYLGDGSFAYNPNINCPNSVFCSKWGDRQFELACGAESACDEKVQGESCGPSKICDANGKCVEKADQPIPICSASLSIASTSGPPCNIEASVSGDCKDKNFEVRDRVGGAVRCTGVTDGSGAGNCGSVFTQTVGATYTYDLYVYEGSGYVKKADNTRTCGGSGGGTTCSGYTDNDAIKKTCDYSLTLNCDWCPGFPSGKCVPEGTFCYSSADCSATSESSCNSGGKCAWCPNEYVYGNSPNGGVCMSSQDLATQCDSCFYSRSYTQSTSGTYCRDKCPKVASGKGYLGGWCVGPGNCLSSEGSCDCKGNKFMWIRNYDGIVNCGECAINANGQDCGGTAEKEALQTGREILGEVFVYGTRYCQPVNNMGDTKSKYPYEDILSCCQAGYPDSASYEYTRSSQGSLATSSYANCYSSSTEGGLVNAKLTSQQGTYEINNQREKKITWTGIRGYQQVVNNPQPLVVVGKYAAGGDRMRDCPIAVFVDNDYLGEFGTPASPFPVAFPKTYLDDGALTVEAQLIDINSEYCRVTDGIIGMSYIEHPVISYSYYSAPAECSDNYDNDQDCLYDCADRDCSESAACAGIAAKKSCGGVCGSCANLDGSALTYQGEPTTCVSGVCEPVPRFDFAVSASPQSAIVKQGVSASTTITTTLTRGTAQSVTLSYSGVPVGATASLTPSPVTPSSTGVTSTFTVTPSVSTPSGQYKITISGTGDGKTRGTLFTLTVSPFDFEVSATQPPAAVVQGSSGTSTVTTTLTSGSSQPVVLSCSGLPEGSVCSFASIPCSGTVSLSLNPNPVSGGSSVTASVSGLYNCNGETAYFFRGNVFVGSCAVSGSGCSITFTSSPSAGTYTYRGFVDISGEGALDSGEYEDKTLTVSSGSATSSCVTLVNNGDPANKLDIVYIGDDYTSLSDFQSKVIDFKNTLFSYAPFSDPSQQSKINVHYVNDISTDLECENVEGIIYCNQLKIEDQASQCPHDQIIVLYNHIGSGNTFRGSNIAYISTALDPDIGVDTGPGIGVHEFGHSFGGLMDEYVYLYNDYPDPSGIWGPNCDIAGCPKWSSISGTGCYAGCWESKWYRSSEDSKMKASDLPFNTVSQNALISKLSAYS